MGLEFESQPSHLTKKISSYDKVAAFFVPVNRRFFRRLVYLHLLLSRYKSKCYYKVLQVDLNGNDFHHLLKAALATKDNAINQGI